MTNKQRLLGIGLACLAILFIVNLTLPKAERKWLHFSGAVMPSGSHTMRYEGKPVRYLSVSGDRWSTWEKLERGYAYHALVLFPQSPVTDGAWSSVSNGMTQTDIERWLVTTVHSANVSSSEQMELSVNYNAIWQTIKVNSETYHLTNGNMFVITFNGSGGHPAVRQLDLRINPEAA